MTVLKNDVSSYQVEVTINGIYDWQIKDKHGNFHRLFLDGGGTLLSHGEPMLPLISQIIAIPPGAEVSASIVEEKWVDIKIGRILPAQLSSRDNYSNNSFQYDERIYYQPYYPPIVSVSREHTWRGIRNVGINVCPLKYYPDENKLSVLSKFILNVSFDRNTDINVKDIVPYAEDFCLFDNTAYSIPNRQRSGINNHNYLIICNNLSILQSDELKKFKIWKALRGFNTTIVSLDSILTSSTYSQDEVKEYIRNEVGSGGYVLLVGDNNSIPTASVNSFSPGTRRIRGDYWYGYDSGYGEWEADIAVGRFSTNSAWEFENMVNKTIRYESTSPLSDSTLLVAHKEDPTYYGGFQYWCEMIRKNNYDEPMSFIKAYGASVENTGTNATNAFVISKINNGVPIVCYIGHGYFNYWGGLFGLNGSSNPNYGWNASCESFYSSEVANMDSTACTVLFANSANTANICVSGNMLEAFTRGTYGAVAYVGSTTEGDGFEFFNESYGYALFDNLLKSGVYHLGDIVNLSLIASVNGNYGGNGYYYAKDNAVSYICGGDPTLELWTATPQSFGDVTLTESNGDITITTQYGNNYKLFVVNENGELIGIHTGNSANTTTFAKPSGNFYLGINKHNYIPHIICYNTDAEFIQNVTFNYDAYYHHTPLDIGYGVTPDAPDGPVIVKEGSKLIIENGTGGVYFDVCFECEKGGVLEVK